MDDFESEQRCDVLDRTLEVTVKGDAVPSPGVPVFVQLVDVAYHLGGELCSALFIMRSRESCEIAPDEHRAVPDTSLFDDRAR